MAIEFRSKQPMPWWRRIWDVSFSVSSIVSALLLGITLVLAYTISIYWIFRGKVKVEPTSY